MHRRTVLALAPALLSGCTAFGDGSPGKGTTSSPTDRPPTATPTDTATATTEPTDTETTESTPTEGPSPELIPAQPKSIPAAEIQNRLDHVSCDGLSELPVVCGAGDDRIGLSLSPTVGSLPTDTVEFTVRNRAEERFQWNPHSWRLRKWDGSQWRTLAPGPVPLLAAHLDPGESDTYRITTDNTTFHGMESYLESQDLAFSGLGPGVYGFEVDDGYFESTPDDELAVAAVFGLAGDGPPVRPTDAVTSVEWKGDDLVVRTGDDDGEAVLVVSFVDGDADIALLPDEVRQVAGLRNTLSYAATEGVGSIRYHGGLGASNDVLRYLSTTSSGDPSRFRFRDYVFEVGKERR